MTAIALPRQDWIQRLMAMSLRSPLAAKRQIVTPLGIAGGGISGPATILHDTFTDAQYTRLSTHAIAPVNVPITAWTTSTYWASINASNQVYGRFTQGVDALCESGVEDKTLTVDCFTSTDMTDFSIYFRYLNTSNYYRAFWSANVWYFFEIAAGVFSVRGSVAYTKSNNTLYSASLVLSGNDIALSVNGVPVLSYSSAVNKTYTKVGMAMTGGETCYIDNFKVTVP